jgi:hypothetical protein
MGLHCKGRSVVVDERREGDLELLSESGDVARDLTNDRRIDVEGRPSQVHCIGQHALGDPWPKSRLGGHIDIAAEKLPATR